MCNYCQSKNQRNLLSGKNFTAQDRENFWITPRISKRRDLTHFQLHIISLFSRYNPFFTIRILLMIDFRSYLFAINNLPNLIRKVWRLYINQWYKGVKTQARCISKTVLWINCAFVFLSLREKMREAWWWQRVSILTECAARNYTLDQSHPEKSPSGNRTLSPMSRFNHTFLN